MTSVNLPSNDPLSKRGESTFQRQPPSVMWQAVGVTVVIVTGAVIGLILAELAYKVALFVKEKWTGRECKIDEETHKLFKPLIDRLEKCTHWKSEEVRKRFALSSEDERTVLNYLHEHFEISETQMKEIRCGAHVVLEDGGDAFNYFQEKLKEKSARRSSHHSDHQQFAVRGELVSEMLFGTTNRGTKTWFQMEKSPFAFGSIISHAWDYMMHCITGQNIGPAGSSVHTDHNPLHIKRKKD